MVMCSMHHEKQVPKGLFRRRIRYETSVFNGPRMAVLLGPAHQVFPGRVDDLARLALGQAEGGDQLMLGAPPCTWAHRFPSATSFIAAFPT